ncbi:hypothetical protein AAFF_G00231960 [Aldrovandia affinis]|uniref:Uncharacterized protein n=1 Tax=Aldrovandia affinis TaxID=143900 RepID=A0AAD7W4Y6_9TELE|nr:hypothetical protein AAFF_G00231960 [Aldrovandia affinis]
MRHSGGPESGPEVLPAESRIIMGTGQHSLDGNRPEEQEEVGGASIRADSMGIATPGIGTTGLLDHFVLMLIVLQDVWREVLQVHLDSTREGRGDEAPETKAPADPETLHRITESLLEESDEEEGDLCRI